MRSAFQQLDAGTATKAEFSPISVAVNAAGDVAVAWDDTTVVGMSQTDTVAVSTATTGKPFTAAQIITGGFDPAIGIDGSGQVSMVDSEGAAEVDRDWAAGTAAPPSGTTLSPGTDDCVGTVNTKLAVAPDGDAIAG